MKLLPFVQSALCTSVFLAACVGGGAVDNADDSALSRASTANATITRLIDGIPEPIACREGETALSYQLDGESIQIQRKDIGLTGEIHVLSPQAAENDSSGYRFDLCVNDANDVYLKRMVRRAPDMSPWSKRHDLFVPVYEDVDPVWAEALGEGGSPDLSVKFVDTANPETSVLVKGWRNDQGVSFVTVSAFDANAADALVLSGDSVTFGRLVEGDPFALPSYHENNRRVKTSNLEIELYYDVKNGQNNYKEYRVHTIRVSDRTPGLSSPISVALYGAALDTALQVNKTHHSLMDSFVITLPDATYKIGQGLEVTYRPDLHIPAVSENLGCTEVSQCGSPIDLLRQ